MKTNKEIEEAMEKLKEIYADKELMQIIEMRQFGEWERAMDLQEATERGEKRGIKKRKKRRNKRTEKKKKQ